MKDILQLERYPLAQLGSEAGRQLLSECMLSLERDGMFMLSSLVRPAALDSITREVQPLLDRNSFTHTRSHNVYFENEIPGVPPDHPALQEGLTTNHTVCGDQIPQSLVCRIYKWPPLVEFLARVMNKNQLYWMDDPLAAVNVLEYRAGEAALNWHFDRSEFTTTLLLRPADNGGEFQYRSNLRTPDDPNYEGVAALLAGDDSEIHTLTMAAGTLCVFRGIDTVHRVTPVTGAHSRVMAVLSYYERPGVRFSEEELLGFYGRIQ